MKNQATNSTQPSLRALIADDAYSMTFQSLPQYRAALLQSLAALANQTAPTVQGAWRDALRRSGATDHHGRIAFLPSQLEQFVSMLTAQQPAQEQAEPVDGDMLPPVGTKVLIHLGRQDEWVEHTVTGYYVWPACKHQVKNGEKDAHRVFVRVKDARGYDNARLLSEVKFLSQASHQEPVVAHLQATEPTHCDPAEGFCSVCRARERTAQLEGRQGDRQ